MDYTSNADIMARIIQGIEMWKESHPPTPTGMESPWSRGPIFALQDNKELSAAGQQLRELNNDRKNLYTSSLSQYNAMERSLPSRDPVPSSIYSDPDTEREHHPAPSNIYLHPSSRYSENHYSDASPPISPMPGQHKHFPTNDPADISPIEEPQASIFQRSGPTSLPKFIRTPQISGTLDEVNSYLSPRSQVTSSKAGPMRFTKWDDVSGDSANNNRARPIQTTLKKPFGFFSKNKESNDSRKQSQRPDFDGDAFVPPVRPPWKGSSGRSAIFDPVSTIRRPPEERPFVPPPRNDSRTAATRSTRPPFERPFYQGANGPTSSATPPRLDTLEFARPQGDQTTPTGPRAEYDENDLSRLLHSPPHRSPPFRTEARIREIPLEPDYNVLQNLELGSQPVSRFSATTYATTEAGSSPPQTSRRSDDVDTPPVPAVPSNIAMKPLKPAARKPTPSQASVSSITSKVLPPSPPEMEAGNRIESMEAKLRDLARRRENINTIVHELTQVIQPSSIAYDLATRAEVSKTVKSLNNELDDIKKEEHDIGLKLHRAYKKRDEADFYCEPSGLWIRRVTA